VSPKPESALRPLAGSWRTSSSRQGIRSGTWAAVSPVQRVSLLCFHTCAQSASTTFTLPHPLPSSSLALPMQDLSYRPVLHSLKCFTLEFHTCVHHTLIRSHINRINPSTAYCLLFLSLAPLPRVQQHQCISLCYLHRATQCFNITHSVPLSFPPPSPHHPPLQSHSLSPFMCVYERIHEFKIHLSFRSKFSY
jgi:hypothetical protein